MKAQMGALAADMISSENILEREAVGNNKRSNKAEEYLNLIGHQVSVMGDESPNSERNFELAINEV